MTWPPDIGVKPYFADDAVCIYHGDAQEILPLLSPVDMIFTDPPYGHNNNNGDLIHKWEEALGIGPAGEARSIKNDSPEQANELARWLFRLAPQMLATGGCCCCCCCCGGGGPDPQFARWSLWMEETLDFKQMVIWDKGPMGLGWHYRRSYETILIGQKRGGACKWYDKTDRVENIIRWPRIGKIIPSAIQHPTEKPLELAAHFILLHSQPGEVILDPFMGSGSTLRAAKNLGRKAIGIELDDHWCAVAAKRMAQAVLL